MTHELEYIGPDKSVTDVFDWMINKGYTAAPLEEVSAPYYFVTSQQVEQANENSHDSESIREHAQRLNLDRLVSPDTEFQQLLDLLHNELFYFIGWNDNIEGIITRADLNKPPAYAFLYTKIYQIESYLRDIVNNIVFDDFIEENTRNTIEKYEKHGDADLQLRLVDYTTFGELKSIINNHEKVWNELPFNGKDDTVRILGDIKEIRNEIAHYGNIIDVMEIDQGSNDRDVRDLKRIYSDMNSIIDNSQS